MSTAMSPNEVLKTFKSILKEASKVVDRPMNSVSISQFQLVSAGRLGIKTIQKYGGYIAMREWAAPGGKNTNAEAVKVFQRIMKHVKSA